MLLDAKTTLKVVNGVDWDQFVSVYSFPVSSQRCLVAVNSKELLSHCSKHFITGQYNLILTENLLSEHSPIVWLQ